MQCVQGSPRKPGDSRGKNRDLYQQLPLLIRSPNKTFLEGAKGCQAALEWSKLMRFNVNDKEFLSAVDTLVISYDQAKFMREHQSSFVHTDEIGQIQQWQTQLFFRTIFFRTTFFVLLDVFNVSQMNTMSYIEYDIRSIF